MASSGRPRISTSAPTPRISAASRRLLAKDPISAEVRGIPVTVCSRQHLLTMKRAADRPLDRADIDQLENGPE
jgi:hypothetical protein